MYLFRATYVSANSYLNWIYSLLVVLVTLRISEIIFSPCRSFSVNLYYELREYIKSISTLQIFDWSLFCVRFPLQHVCTDLCFHHRNTIGFFTVVRAIKV